MYSEYVLFMKGKRRINEREREREREREGEEERLI